MKKKLLILALTTMLGLTACGNKTEKPTADTQASIVSSSETESVSKEAESESVSVEVKESEPASIEEKEDSTTDQISLNNDDTFTSSIPLVAKPRNSSEEMEELFYYGKEDLPDVIYLIQTIDEEVYNKHLRNENAVLLPEGVYRGGKINSPMLMFFTPGKDGKYYSISLWSWSQDGSAHADQKKYDIGYQAYEVFLQLVEDLVKSDLTEASEMSDVTVTYEYYSNSDVNYPVLSFPQVTEE